VKIFGFNIQRQKGAMVGSLETAILKAQEDIAKLQRQVGTKTKEASQEDAKQTEIDKVLAGNNHPPDRPDLWEAP